MKLRAKRNNWDYHRLPFMPFLHFTHCEYIANLDPEDIENILHMLDTLYEFHNPPRMASNNGEPFWKGDMHFFRWFACNCSRHTSFEALQKALNDLFGET